MSVPSNHRFLVLRSSQLCICQQTKSLQPTHLTQLLHDAPKLLFNFQDLLQQSLQWLQWKMVADIAKLDVVRPLLIVASVKVAAPNMPDAPLLSLTEMHWMPKFCQWNFALLCQLLVNWFSTAKFVATAAPHPKTHALAHFSFLWVTRVSVWLVSEPWITLAHDQCRTETFFPLPHFVLLFLPLHFFGSFGGHLVGVACFSNVVVWHWFSAAHSSNLGAGTPCEQVKPSTAHATKQAR